MHNQMAAHIMETTRSAEPRVYYMYDGKHLHPVASLAGWLLLVGSVLGGVWLALGV